MAGKTPRKRPEPKVTDKMRRYVDAYLRTGNKRASAREAGYDGWETNYYSIHRGRGVQHELMRRAMEEMDHEPLSPGYVMSSLQEIVHRSMSAEPVRDRNGNLVKMPFQTDDGEVEFAVLHTFDAKAAISALTKMGEHLQLWSPPKEKDDDQAARDRSIKAELQRIADAVEGKQVRIESAPVNMGDGDRRLN